MGFTYGFYNSIDHDRVYNAQQMSSLFNGIINDGVFQSVGDWFATTPGDGMQVVVGTGRAWFDSTWNDNDEPMLLNLEFSDIVLSRYDTVVIEINETNRTNSIKVVTGTPSMAPTKPVLTNTALVHQHPIAHILIGPAAESITASNIQIVVGTTECPFVTAILETTDLTPVYERWEDEFNQWFENLKEQLGDNVATNLQNQIDARVKYTDAATAEDVEAGESTTKYLTPATSGAGNLYIDGHKCKIRATDDGDFKFIDFNGDYSSEEVYEDLNYAISPIYRRAHPAMSYDMTLASVFYTQSDTQAMPTKMQLIYQKNADTSQKLISFSEADLTKSPALTDDYFIYYRWKYTENNSANSKGSFIIYRLSDGETREITTSFTCYKSSTGNVRYDYGEYSGFIGVKGNMAYFVARSPNSVTYNTKINVYMINAETGAYSIIAADIPWSGSTYGYPSFSKEILNNGNKILFRVEGYDGTTSSGYSAPCYILDLDSNEVTTYSSSHNIFGQRNVVIFGSVNNLVYVAHFPDLSSIDANLYSFTLYAYDENDFLYVSHRSVGFSGLRAYKIKHWLYNNTEASNVNAGFPKNVYGYVNITHFEIEQYENCLILFNILYNVETGDTISYDTFKANDANVDGYVNRKGRRFSSLSSTSYSDIPLNIMCGKKFTWSIPISSMRVGSSMARVKPGKTYSLYAEVIDD